MARYKNGINGAFSGKVGNVIGASWRGIDYMRSLPEPSSKPASPLQLNRRKQFAVAMAWLKPLLSLINIGYQSAEAKTPLNAALSYYLKEAVNGEAPDYCIDFEKAIFSRGELMTSFIKEVLPLENSILHISWGNAPVTIFSGNNDLATFIIYNPEKEKFITFTEAVQRAEKEAFLELPVPFAGDEVHAYMYYVNESGDQLSTSLYLGQFLMPIQESIG